eukprot:gene19124-19488_t
MNASGRPNTCKSDGIGELAFHESGARVRNTYTPTGGSSKEYWSMGGSLNQPCRVQEDGPTGSANSVPAAASGVKDGSSTIAVPLILMGLNVLEAAYYGMIDAEARKRGDQTGLDTLVVHALNDEYSITPARVKLKGIDGGPHKRRSMWFNSMIREEPYPGLKSRNERNPYEGTTSSHHGPYVRGYTRATMGSTEGSYLVTGCQSQKAVHSSDRGLQLDPVKLDSLDHNMNIKQNRNGWYPEYREVGDALWEFAGTIRTEPINVEKFPDDLWVGVKG